MFEPREPGAPYVTCAFVQWRPPDVTAGLVDVAIAHAPSISCVASL